MEKLKKQIEVAVNAFKDQRILEAEELTKKLIIENPKVAFLYNLLGLIFIQQQKFDQAFETYNKGIEVVGDRFVFPSEILFDLGSDELQGKGLVELSQMAKVIRKIVKKIPKNIDWILRVDGHTDKTKFLKAGKFTDNWELSQARALSVVKYFVTNENLPAKRFAAAGFGEFQPIDVGETEKALARNRRIEIKLTER